MVNIRRRTTVTLSVLATMLMAGFGWAQQQIQPEPRQGPIGKVGQALDGAGKSIKRGVVGAENAVQESFARTRASVHNMELVSRVYSRLHWEKALITANLDIEVKADGVAVLRGTVPDAAAKTKAVSLTADTVGVVQVIDQLAVAPATRIVPGTPVTTEPLPEPVPK